MKEWYEDFFFPLTITALQFLMTVCQQTVQIFCRHFSVRKTLTSFILPKKKSLSQLSSFNLLPSYSLNFTFTRSQQLFIGPMTTTTFQNCELLIQCHSCQALYSVQFTNADFRVIIKLDDTISNKSRYTRQVFPKRI